MRAAARVQEAISAWTDSPRKRLAVVVKPQLVEILEFLGPVGWAAALVSLLLASFNGLLFAVGNNATLALSLAGSSVVHVSSRPSGKDILATAVIAGTLRTLYLWFVGPIANYPGSAWISWGSFLGLASLLTLGARTLTAGNGRRVVSEDFRGAGAFLYFWIIGVFALQLTPRTMPETMDRFLYAFDASLGFEPSFVAGRVLAGLPLLLQSLTFMQYQALLLGLAIVYAWQRMRPSNGTPRILPVTVSMMIVGYLVYQLYPAAGPWYAFGPLFPVRPPEILHLAIVPIPLHSAARNAIPSLHMATAVLIWWHSRGSHWLGRLLAGLFLLATAFSTMATGEHYFIDLVVAFPFTMAIQADWATTISVTARARYLPLGMGTFMTFAWLALLRFGIGWLFLSPVLPWLLVSFTVVYAVSAEMKLAAAGRELKQYSST